MSELSEQQKEQTYLDALYQRLDDLRADTQSALDSVRTQQVGGNFQNRSERDAFASLYEDRLVRYRSAEEGLCFGRIDSAEGASTYIGRIGLSDQTREQMLMDWRAPASEPFYRATAAQPAGVARRRHIATSMRTVTGVEDDLLDYAQLTAEDLHTLQGEGALIAAMEAKRTGRMNDIVATIQAEQDVIIRQDIAGTLVVQGGPGTGKTAVALHRAAYLLFQHRERIARSGVLIVGPSPVFLRYIEKVLPSLGETGAILLTPKELVPGYTAEHEDLPQVAELKGDLRMVEVVRSFVRSYQRVPDSPQVLRVGPYAVTLRPEVVRSARERARRSGKPHNRARTTFVAAVLRSLAAELAAARNMPVLPENVSEFESDLRMAKDVKVAVNLCWLPLTPAKALKALLSKPHRLRQAAKKHLSAEEIGILLRPAQAPLTTSDIPLIDEIAELIGEVPSEAGEREDHDRNYAEDVLAMTATGGMVSAAQLAQRYAGGQVTQSVADRAVADREWTFGHLIVDEAQELSPMQLRLLFRRVPSKSATLVGDLAQASTLNNTRSWARTLSPFVGDRFRVEELTVSYRTPSNIMALAQRLMETHRPQLKVPAAVREGDFSPRFLSFDSVTRLAGHLAEAVTAETAQINGGRLAVIRSRDLAELVDHALTAGGITDYATGSRALDRTIAVLSPYETKGLEFDSVIIVEPALITGTQAPFAIGELYVALTRTTSRLTVMSSQKSVLSPFEADFA